MPGSSPSVVNPWDGRTGRVVWHELRRQRVTAVSAVGRFLPDAS